MAYRGGVAGRGVHGSRSSLSGGSVTTSRSRMVAGHSGSRSVYGEVGQAASITPVRLRMAELHRPLHPSTTDRPALGQAPAPAAVLVAHVSAGSRFRPPPSTRCSPWLMTRLRPLLQLQTSASASSAFPAPAVNVLGCEDREKVAESGRDGGS